MTRPVSETGLPLCGPATAGVAPGAASYTYDPRLSTARDRMRRGLGDTDPEEWLLSDQEIDATLAQFSNDETAALSALARYAMASEARRATTLTSAEGDVTRYDNRLKVLQGLVPADVPVTTVNRRRRTRLPYRGDE